MKNFNFTLILLSFLAITLKGQNNVGINDDNSSPKASAMLDVYSESKGLLIPRIALTSTTAAAPVTSPEASLLVYNTSVTGDVTPGYYYWNGSSKWVRLVVSADPEKNFNLVSKSADATLLKTENLVFATGDITLTLPTVIETDNGLEITIKNTGTYTDLVTVEPEAGKTIDANSNSLLTRWKGRTFIAIGGNWMVKEKEIMTDNLLEVSASGSFTTIAEVVAFLDVHMSGPTIVRLGGGSYEITETQTINLPYPVTFQGLSFGETIIECPNDGSTAFVAQTECYFKLLTFNAGTSAGIAINLSGADTYYEIKDGYFFGLTKAVILQESVDLWLFEVDFEDCSTAAVEIDAGSTKDVIFRISESDYYNCAIGINLLSAGPGTEISVLNGTFYNTSSGQKGINYVPTTGSNNFRFTSMIIQNNSFNNIGSFASGFDFSLDNGRDAEAFIENNAGVSAERPHCKINVANSTASTTITTANTWYKAANFSSYTSVPTKWTVANNRITYQTINIRDGVMFISGNIRCNNSSRTLNIAIVKNGISSTRFGETTVRIPSNSANQSFQFSTNVYLPNLIKDQYFEIWLTSSSNGDVLTIDDLNWYSDTH